MAEAYAAMEAEGVRRGGRSAIMDKVDDDDGDDDDESGKPTPTITG